MTKHYPAVNLHRFLFLAFVLLLSLPTMAEQFEVDGIYYNSTSNTECEVVPNPDKYVGEITIPATVEYNGTMYLVTAVGEEAFSECQELTSVVLPNSIRIIGYGAFQYSSINTMTLPESVTNLDFYAFFSCTRLTSINIPNNVTFINEYNFASCYNLREIIISKDHPHYTLQDGVLYDKELTYVLVALKSDRTEFTMPNTVRYIAYGAFSEMRQLRNIKLSESLERIGDSAFNGCPIESLRLPSSLQYIGSFAFGVAKITTLNIPKSVNYIGQNAFNIKDLVYIGVDEDNEYYMSEDGVLYDKQQTSLETYPGSKPNDKFYVPETVTSIRAQAFTGNEYIKHVILPPSVTVTGYCSFSFCSSLEKIDFPNTLKEIGGWLFEGCGKCEKFVIPESVETIGTDAFPDKAKEVHMLGSKVYNFKKQGNLKNCKLYVPAGSYNEYAASDFGKSFTEIIEERALDGNDENSIEETGNGDVIIKVVIPRDIWTTLCLPFNISKEMLEDIFGVKIEIALLRNSSQTNGKAMLRVEAEQTTLYFDSAKEVPAGVPFLIRPTKDVINPFFCDVAIPSSEPKEVTTADGRFTLKGAFNPTALPTDGSVMLITNEGGLCVPTTETNMLKGFQAYLVANNGDSMPNVSINGNVVSGISNVTTDEAAGNRKYNLNGQYVGTSLHGLAKGVYVNNGKKVVVK